MASHVNVLSQALVQHVASLLSDVTNTHESQYCESPLLLRTPMPTTPFTHTLQQDSCSS